MSSFRPWEGAKSCTGKVTPGAAALLAWLLANRVPPGRSGGIYNCREVAGSGIYSIHSEGRALDWMLPVDPVTKRGTPHGHTLVNLLVENAWELGLQCIIYDRTIWSAVSPRGREYKGVHAHYDHPHIELAWVGARNLNLATCVELLGGSIERPEQPGAGTGTPVKPPAPKPPASKEDSVMTKLPTVNLKNVKAARSTWVLGQNVRSVQGLLVARGQSSLKVDGVGGPATRAAVITFQKSKRLAADAIVGEDTWAALLRV